MPQDASALQTLYEKSLREASWVPLGTEPSPDIAAASAGERVVVCVSAAEELKGFVSVWEPESFLHHLYVDRRFQRQRVASVLLESLEDWLPKPWRLKCVQSNHGAMAFYRQNGWKAVATGRGKHGRYRVMEKR